MVRPCPEQPLTKILGLKMPSCDVAPAEPAAAPGMMRSTSAQMRSTAPLNSGFISMGSGHWFWSWTRCVDGVMDLMAFSKSPSPMTIWSMLMASF